MQGVFVKQESPTALKPEFSDDGVIEMASSTVSIQAVLVF